MPTNEQDEPDEAAPAASCTASERRFETCHCARLSPKLLHLVILTPARQRTQREFTAKLAVDRTKLVGMYISMVDFLGSMQSGAVPC